MHNSRGKYSTDLQGSNDDRVRSPYSKTKIACMESL